MSPQMWLKWFGIVSRAVHAPRKKVRLSMEPLEQRALMAVVVTPGPATTTEAGGTTTFDIVLDSQPVSNVEIQLASDDSTEGVASTNRVTFTPLDWNVTQTVTVTGVDDTLLDGDQGYTIVTSAAISSDPAYSGLAVNDVALVNQDNEDDGPPPGVTVSAVSGDTTEAGGTATFTVVLDSQPASNVQIQLSSSDATEGSVSPNQLTFTTLNWNVAQTVTITGVDDTLDDGDIGYSIITSDTISSDPKYSGLLVGDVGLNNVDNEPTPGVTVSAASGDTTEAGVTATFTVVLDSQPASNVEIRLNSSDTTEGIISKSRLIFTRTNWAVTQAVTVYGRDDAIDDGDQLYSIVTSAPFTSDPKYKNLAVADVPLTNVDNDGPLLAEGQPVPGIEGQRLSSAALRPIVSEALARWEANGLTAAERRLLRQAQFTIADLGGDVLGLAAPGRTIFLDDDAAGFGWFIDSTAGLDEEFGLSLGADARAAAAGSIAFGKMDLLTVVLHELGHWLGRADLDSSIVAHDLMSDHLAAGVRHGPGSAEQIRDALFAGLDGGNNSIGKAGALADRVSRPLWMFQ